MNERVGEGEVLLAGGGTAEDSEPIDEWLVERTGDNSKMGYIPVAMPSEKYPDCLEWITSVFEPYGLTNIEMWADLTKVTTETVAEVDAIYIGGGNTYRLLDRVRTAELEPLLRQFVADGGVLYRGSAGAILCDDILPGVNACLLPTSIPTSFEESGGRKSTCEPRYAGYQNK